MHVWKFARSIDEQFVQGQVFDLEISAAGWDPLFRRLGTRKLSRAILRHHFEHARMAQVQDRGGDPEFPEPARLSFAGRAKNSASPH